MKIKVNEIKNPAQKIKVSFQDAGRKGGSAKVPKGFAKMGEKRLHKIAVDAAKKRWGK